MLGQLGGHHLDDLLAVMPDRETDQRLVAFDREGAVVLGQTVAQPERQHRELVVQQLMDVLLVDETHRPGLAVDHQGGVVAVLVGHQVARRAAGLADHPRPLVEGATGAAQAVGGERRLVGEDVEQGGDRRVELAPWRQLQQHMAHLF